MNLNGRFVIGGFLIVAAIGWLMYVGIRETSAYYLTIEEFLPQREAYAGEDLRVAGRVRAGTIEYDPKTLHLRFEIGAFEKDQPAGDGLAVAFTGIKPDMFAEGRDVIVEGRYHEGRLEADKVMTSCPSKYEAELEPGATGTS